MIVVEGGLRDYAWGRIDGLVPWVAPTDGPQAELWFGGRVAAEVDGHRTDDGSDNRADTADTCAPADHPLLVKLLAAATPLSIQVHPPGDVVERLWADQGHGRSLLTDRTEKNELLLALEPFTAFAGFRDAASTSRILHGLALHDAAELAAGGDHVGAIATLLREPRVVVDEAFRHLSDVIHPLLEAYERSAIELVRSWYPHDRGALVALCLAVHELAPGDAIHVPAGVVHSYVNGLGVEVMTASDNVLRLGLTPKQIAVEEALSSVSAATPTVIRSPVDDLGTTAYDCGSSPFAVWRLHGPTATWSEPAAASTTVLVVRGSATVVTPVGERVIPSGQAALVGPDEGPVTVDADGLVVVASHRPPARDGARASDG